MNTEITPHLKVVQHPNPKYRSFHVVRELLATRTRHGFGRDLFLSCLSEKELQSGEEEEAKNLAKRLTELPGVTSGSIEQYEITVVIGDAFSWRDIGPLVLGEIVKAVYPEVDGGTLEISTIIGWSYYVRSRSYGFDGDDTGHRTHYQDMADHKPVDVTLGTGRPRLDIEHMFSAESLQEAKQKKATEAIYED